ncbi:hypothetical protein GHC57_18880 [Roseospira navarrensis]|uniref:Uncharacterized protein n=2 Tax=Roseospira navarrensis TaxID=140058 RepID=A0A7X1ZHP3_9PROT|nr:hypothetical protein [Roseospira navarrensis]
MTEAPQTEFPSLRLLNLAKLAEAKKVDLHLFDGGVRAFLDAHAERRQTKPTPAQSFTQADAEYAQKLHAMAERGTEHEAEVAKGKLEGFAKGFGMSADEVVGKAEEVN